ncbi:MAG: CbbQ/NirQ/NorQ C-terminal domain-containing protein, partial [Janthinobacterium lividum]
LVVSYNPGYQSAAKDLKESTKQRFVAIDFTYPDPAAEADIVARETGIDPATAALLVDVAGRTRNLRGRGLGEGASTRMLIHAASLITAGIPLPDALRAAVALPLTDDPDMRDTLDALIAACLP